VYTLRIKREAEKELQSLPREVFARVNAAILALRENPRPPGVEKLAGGEGWRIRVGSYRVLFEIDEATKEVTIYRVRHRREVYRR